MGGLCRGIRIRIIKTITFSLIIKRTERKELQKTLQNAI